MTHRMIRSQHMAGLKKNDFDILIIGAGASGAGAALDAAMRGLSVALIDRDDFSASTSSKSTKLIHGGVRYLEQAVKNFDLAQLKQVRHGLQERYNVIKNAPFLAHPLALMTPCYSWFEGLYFAIGLKIYDWFAGNDPLPKSKWLGKEEALSRIKGLKKDLHSAVLYYDGQLDDARYNMLLAKTAAESGANVANYVSVVDFQKNAEGKLSVAVVKDEITGEQFEIRAQLMLNCTGPAADTIRIMANATKKPRIQKSKGVHAILPLSVLGNTDTALLIPKTTDGRVIFAIPFQGHLLLGTTDTPYEVSGDDEPLLEEAEVDFLLENLNRYTHTPVDRSAITAGFGGLRPLLSPEEGNKDTKSLVRDHEVEIDETTGLISLMGGKWTTYRLMAADVVDVACQQLGNKTKCTTQDKALSGAERYSELSLEWFIESLSLPRNLAKHLWGRYGRNAYKVGGLIRLDKSLADPIVAGHPFIKAEAVFAVREEMALTDRKSVV